MRKNLKSTDGKPTEQVMHLILVLCILGMAYTFFAKTELGTEPANKLLTPPAEVEREVDKLNSEGSR